MKAAVIERQGGVENLVFRDWPDPEIGADEVLMRVAACALNYLDLEVRRGMPGLKVPMPFISGGDMAGVVEAVGGDVETVAVGDRIVFDPVTRDGWTAEGIEWLLGEVAAGRIEAVIDSTYPLSEIRAAETRLESREAFGKVVLHP